MHSETGDKQFKRQDNGPLEDVVPAHGKTPGRIDEASRVGIETTRDRVHDSEFTKSVDWLAVSTTYAGQGRHKEHLPTLKIMTPMMEKSINREAGPWVASQRVTPGFV